MPPLVVAAIAMDRELSDRTSRAKQFALAKKIIAEAFKTPIAGLGGKEVGLCTQGLFFFHDEVGNFRISLVTCGLKGRRLVSTTAKRQSFFCRPSARNNIVKRQLDPEIKSFENLQKAFSVEGITKEFYNKLFAWYQWACDKKTGVTFPNKIHDSRDDRDKLPEAIIRLITRLMFVWFVRQKGLIPDDLFRRERVEELLNDGFCPDSIRDGTYYRAILQNLFFATLNCPIEDRRFVQSSDSANPQAWARSDFRCTTKYRYREAFRSEKVKEFLDLMRQVPFLNCALFDCLDRRFDKVLDADEIERNGGEWEIFTDGFSRRGATGKSPSYQAFVPNALFFYDQPNEEGRQGIISLFIIENCIYGVDIQPIATQIAKLRFFISLLCDQLRNHRETDARGEVTYHLLALPNLEAKFACANTLISLPKMEGTLDFSTPEITQLRKKLAAQRRRYFFRPHLHGEEEGAGRRAPATPTPSRSPTGTPMTRTPHPHSSTPTGCSASKTVSTSSSAIRRTCSCRPTRVNLRRSI